MLAWYSPTSVFKKLVLRTPLNERSGARDEYPFAYSLLAVLQ